MAVPGATMTLRIGMRENKHNTPTAFTLVELILVMALLATIMALAAPSLSRSMHQRHVADEAARFLAATEYARDEAVSQGVPMTLWIEPATGRFGVEPKTGFFGADERSREFEINPDIHFETSKAVATRGLVQAVEFAPDGAPDSASLAEIRLVDRFNSSMTIARTKDGWAYEILPESK